MAGTRNPCIYANGYVVHLHRMWGAVIKHQYLTRWARERAAYTHHRWQKTTTAACVLRFLTSASMMLMNIIDTRQLCVLTMKLSTRLSRLKSSDLQMSDQKMSESEKGSTEEQNEEDCCQSHLVGEELNVPVRDVWYNSHCREEDDFGEREKTDWWKRRSSYRRALTDCH